MAQNRNIAVCLLMADFFLFGCGRSVNPMPTPATTPPQTPTPIATPAQSPTPASTQTPPPTTTPFPTPSPFPTPTPSVAPSRTPAPVPTSSSSPTPHSHRHRQQHHRASSTSKCHQTINHSTVEFRTQGIGQHLCLQPGKGQFHQVFHIARHEQVREPSNDGRSVRPLQLCHGQKSFRGELV